MISIGAGLIGSGFLFGTASEVTAAQPSDTDQVKGVIVAFKSALSMLDSKKMEVRTQAGLQRAKAAGKALGRPTILTAAQQDAVRRKRAKGFSLGMLAKEYGVSRSAIQRIQKRAASQNRRGASAGL